jgi:hydroxymethylpyrimidine/phosphomethylpyrimidine kinase
MKGRVLIVAGSDSGGGAGHPGRHQGGDRDGRLRRDRDHRADRAEHEGVHGVVPVEPAFIAQQIEVVLTDIGATALKTGMLHSAEVIDTVVSSFAGTRPAWRWWSIR